MNKQLNKKLYAYLLCVLLLGLSYVSSDRDSPITLRHLMIASALVITVIVNVL